MSFNDDPLAAGLPKEGEDSMAEILGGFPRHLTTQLIEEGAEHESRRQVIGVWVLAVALTLFALATPAEPAPWGATFGRSAWALVPDAWPGGHGPLQRALESLLGAHQAEQLRLLLSAVAYGLCLPATFAITRRFGAEFGLRLAIGFVVLLSAGAWLAGTDPAGSSITLLFALELFRRTWNGAPGLRVRALIGLTLYALVVPVLSTLLPAILIAGLDGEGDARAQRRKAALAAVGVVVVLVLARWGLLTLAGTSLWDAFGASVTYGPAAESPSGLESLLQTGLAAGGWTLRSLASLGVAALGLAALVLLRRGEAEEQPPYWLVLWCLVPLLTGAGAPAGLAGLEALLLLPVAIVGLMDLVARQDVAAGRGLALLLSAVQVALLVACLSLVGADRPLRRWQEEAIRTLEPSDLVVSADSVHREQLRRRWDLDVVAARPYGLTPGVELAVERAWAAGRRVAVDVGSFHADVGPALAATLAERGEVVPLGSDAPTVAASVGGGRP